MKKEFNEKIRKMFENDNFPTRQFVIYLLFVIFNAVLSIPLTERIAALTIKSMQVDPAQSDIMLAFLSHIDILTIVSSIIGAVISTLLFGLIIWGASRMVGVEFNYNQGVMMCIVLQFILIVNDFLSLGINAIIGIDTITSIHDTDYTSIAAIFNKVGVYAPFAFLSAINPFTIIAFTFMAYCWSILPYGNKKKAVGVSLALFCIYTLVEASMMSIGS